MGNPLSTAAKATIPLLLAFNIAGCGEAPNDHEQNAQQKTTPTTENTASQSQEKRPEKEDKPSFRDQIKTIQKDIEDGTVPPANLDNCITVENEDGSKTIISCPTTNVLELD